MNKYVIVFHYLDGEVLNVDVHPDDMASFMASINAGEVFFSDARGVGLWIPVDRIRYFEVEKVDGQGNRVKGSDSQLRDEDAESGAPSRVGLE